MWRWLILLETEFRITRRATQVLGGAGNGTATLEAKLAQHLSGLAQDSILQVFMDIRNLYDSLDRGYCLETLKGYGLGPNLAHLLTHYCEWKRIVPKAGKFLRKYFGTEIGVTKGDPPYPHYF